MTFQYLEYPLAGGYIHNWLVAGPQAIPVLDLDRFGEQKINERGGSAHAPQIARHFYAPESGINETPAERAGLVFKDANLTWEYIRCDDDHFVDRSAFYHTCHYLRSWAYAELVCPAVQQVTCVLTTNGPADMWLNGKHVHRHEHFYHQLPHSVAFQATLQEGANAILVRFEEVALRECPYALALRIDGLPEGETRVQLPTTIANALRRQLLERVFAAAYLDRTVFMRSEMLVVHWPEDLQAHPTITLRLQGGEWIYAEGQKPAQNSVDLVKGFAVLEGDYKIVLQPATEELYAGGLYIKQELPLHVSHNPHAEAPYRSYEQRRLEALADAADRVDTVFNAIAQMELERWSELSIDIIHKTIDGINQRADCSDFYMVGLLGVLHRYADDPAFPAQLKEPLEACVLNFKYWLDEPGNDAMCYWSENHQILFHACAVLAGQLFPDHVFSNTGQTGAWHRAKGERMARSWLHKRGTGGFREWDSNCYFEHDVLALAHLADLAESDDVRELAAVVLDKLLFSLALNSFKGVFGSTHGRTYTPLIKGGRLEATSGVARLLWGMGTFNHHALCTVSLACATSYELPPIIAAIACDQPEELWSRERHAGELEQWCDLEVGHWEVNKVTYKTPDYMLCSAQDYQPGQPGYQQHIWQATFGPDAVVFVTHPPCLSEEGSHRPNFWHGNVVLPRVAQWRDVLLAIHKLPDEDWLGFTHAYFPRYAFDEYVLRDGWAFGRKEQGYVALTAARGLEQSTSGANAYRELRSYGSENVWLCHMGRAALDGDFASFQRKILSLAVHFDGLSVRCDTLRDETLAFGWQGPLLVGGVEQPISGFKHYDSPYCVADLPTDEMLISYGDEALRLTFAG